MYSPLVLVRFLFIMGLLYWEEERDQNVVFHLKMEEMCKKNNNWKPLRKHAYWNNIENFTTKKGTFSVENSNVFHISAQNIDCGYSLEPPLWIDTQHFLSIKKNWCFFVVVVVFLFSFVFFFFCLKTYFIRIALQRLLLALPRLLLWIPTMHDTLQK